MKNFFSSWNRKPIVTTLLGIFVTFLLTKVFDPILETLYSIFLRISSSFTTTFSDITYQKIANGFNNQESIFLMNFIFLSTCFLLPFVSNVIREQYTRDTEKIENLLQKTSNLTRKLKGNEAFSGTKEIVTEEISNLSFEQLAEIVNTLHENLLTHVPSLKKIYKKLFTITTALLFSVFIIFTFSYSRTLFINRAITITTNNIEIVSPYISDHDYKKLKSDFYSIQNKDDYDKLQQTLNTVAKEHSLILKE